MLRSTTARLARASSGVGAIARGAGVVPAASMRTPTRMRLGSSLVSSSCTTRAPALLTGLHPHSHSRSLATPSSSSTSARSSAPAPRIPADYVFDVHPTYRASPDGPLLSRVSGPTTDPLVEDASLGSFWARDIVSRYADRPALVVKHEPSSQHSLIPSSSSSSATASPGTAESGDCLRWTFSQMDSHIRTLARGLSSLGIRRGSVVAVLMMNNSAYAALQWATSMLGAVLVTLNPSYSQRELGQALLQVNADTLVLVPGLRSSDYLAAVNALLPSLRSGSEPSSSSNGGSGREASEAKEVHEPSLPALRRLILVDNLTARPARYGSTSVHAQRGLSFAQALEALGGRAHDYREVLARGETLRKGKNGKEEREGDKGEWEKIDPEEVINLQLTSGTTGRPKAVALTSKNLLNNGIAIGRTLRMTPNDILCNVPPLFHCFGLTLGNLAAWTHGSAVVYSAEGFDPVRALRSVHEERCTAIHGVPAHFIAELEVLDAMKAHREHAAGGSPSDAPKLPAGVEPGETYDLTSLRTGLTSGSTVPIELMHRIINDVGSAGQTVVAGMTETSPVSFGCDVDAPIARRCETVGKIYPHAHARIIDPDDPEGKPLPVGEAGELCVAGYIIMKGYLNDPAKTAEVIVTFPDEPHITWIKTGDIATMDEEGYTRFVGRSKDIIIRGGENLFPVQVENCIDELPGIAQSAAVAVPDKRMGEAVGVFLGRSRSAAGRAITAAQVRQHVKDFLTPQSAPDWIWWLGEQGVDDEFPKTASGKVRKIDLRNLAVELMEKGIGRVGGAGTASKS